MKVVLFCGGLGMRMRECSEAVPKPMIHIGHRPILWHIMKYYAHYGHKDFILCLGYKSSVIRNYFLKYNENYARGVDYCDHINDWKITFVNTGTASNIGQRLQQVKRHVENEDFFLANYADGLSDLVLPQMIDDLIRKDKIASLLAVRPQRSFHVVSSSDDGVVDAIGELNHQEIRINGGYFIFRRDIFNYIHAGEELVQEPFQRLITARMLVSYKYDGFWMCMDTPKEKQILNDLYAQGETPWEVWHNQYSNNNA